MEPDFEITEVKRECEYARSIDEAKLIRIRGILKGYNYVETNPYKSGFVVVFLIEKPLREIKTMTVSDIIILNNIDDFDITFKDALGKKIENPNYNVLAGMIVKSSYVDWLRKTAEISVVTL